MRELPDELASIIEGLQSDDKLWGKVKSLNGAQFDLCCRCNSARLQRVVVQQKKGVVRSMKAMKANDDMPSEIKEILDMCKTNPSLINRVGAFTTSRFDVVFQCGGFGLISGDALMVET